MLKLVWERLSCSFLTFSILTRGLKIRFFFRLFETKNLGYGVKKYLEFGVKLVWGHLSWKIAGVFVLK